jgi:hypothetical protein
MTQNKFSVVTTFNADGYDRYGRRMIETFLQNWPADVVLRVYAENCRVTQTAPNLHVFDLKQTSPELVAFKTKWNNVPKANGDVSGDPVRSLRKDAGKGFKWDAVRFSHKVYSIFHCARSVSTDWLLWMDGDTVCHSVITLSDLDRLCPPDRDLCYLGRQGKYSECGLYAMNLNNTNTKTFLQKFQRMYDDAEGGIFTLDEWHDSYVFDAVRKQSTLNELDWSGHLITGEGHPLINSEWGAYLDHLKGDRKTLGKSKTKDLKVQRQESYWQ